MKILLEIENDSVFHAAWLAAHLGLPKGAVTFNNPVDRNAWAEGYETRAETAPTTVEDAAPHQSYDIGAAHVAMLAEQGLGKHKVKVRIER